MLYRVLGHFSGTILNLITTNRIAVLVWWCLRSAPIYLLYVCSIAAVLNLFRLADHLTKFVSVQGSQKMSTSSWKNFLVSDDLFLAIFPNFFLGSWTTKKNFANFLNFLAFFRVMDKKQSNLHLQSTLRTFLDFM